MIRGREYTDAEIRRWAQAISDGVSNVDFLARFGVKFETARRVAERRGIDVPRERRIERVRRDGR